MLSLTALLADHTTPSGDVYAIYIQHSNQLSLNFGTFGPLNRVRPALNTGYLDATVVNEPTAPTSWSSLSAESLTDPDARRGGTVLWALAYTSPLAQTDVYRIGVDDGANFADARKILSFPSTATNDYVLCTDPVGRVGFVVSNAGVVSMFSLAYSPGGSTTIADSVNVVGYFNISPFRPITTQCTVATRARVVMFPFGVYVLGVRYNPTSLTLSTAVIVYQLGVYPSVPVLANETSSAPSVCVGTATPSRSQTSTYSSSYTPTTTPPPFVQQCGP